MEDRIVHEIFSGIAPIIVGTAVIICVTWIVITIIRALKQRANQKNRLDLYHRILDKFGAAPEFIEYLRSDEGLKFMTESAVESSLFSPLGKILASIQIGVVTILFGAGLLALANIFDRDLGGDLFIVLSVSGTVGLMVGLGLLISAAVSYQLCKRWGLLVKENSQPAENKRQTEN